VSLLIRRRVLVPSELDYPSEALAHAAALAGTDGEVVLASVTIVPHSEPLDTGGPPVPDGDWGADAQAVVGVVTVGTRCLRARSFSEAVLDAVAAERYDAIVIQAGRETPCNGAKAQIEAVLERAAPTVVLVRPG
jgi:hypothetical protein